MRLKNKKALEAEVLIGIIITIAVAAVIFLFMRGWSWKGTIDKEACHQSVLMRSMPSIIGDAMKRSIPLKCKTEDILINFEDEELVKQRIATAMYDCWWMLGEGKLDFFSEGMWKRYSLQHTRTSCVVCATIDFSDRTKNKIKNVDLTDYLQDTNILGKGISYLGYFSDDKGAKLETGTRIEPINTDKKYTVVYMGVKGNEFWDVLVKDVKLAGGTTAWIAGNTFLIKTATGGMAAGTGAAFSVVGNIIKFIANPLVWKTALVLGLTQLGFSIDSQIVSAIHCDGNTQGCNMIMLTEYSTEDIKENCGNIESVP